MNAYDQKRCVTEACSRYEPNAPGSLLNILSDITESLGYLPEEALSAVRERTGVSSGVLHTIIRRSDLYTTEPRGRHVVTLCDGAVCHAKGAGRMIRAVETALGMRAGQTTADGRFSLVVTGCVGSCSHAPVMLIDGSSVGHPALSDIANVLEECG